MVWSRIVRLSLVFGLLALLLLVLPGLPLAISSAQVATPASPVASPVATPYLPGNAASAHVCEQGGYLAFVDGDGTPFDNADQCTSYAAGGGQLWPRPSLTVVFVLVPRFNRFEDRVSGEGLRPGAAITYTMTRQDGSTSTHIIQRVPADGVLNNIHFSNTACGSVSAIVVQTRDRFGRDIAATAALPC